jgi:hypothetical protein
MMFDAAATDSIFRWSFLCQNDQIRHVQNRHVLQGDTHSLRHFFQCQRDRELVRMVF